jgi:hypothetical protein
MMGAINSFETSADFHGTTRRYITEDTTTVRTWNIIYVTYNEYYLHSDTRVVVECSSVTTFTPVIYDNDHEGDSFYNLKHTRPYNSFGVLNISRTLSVLMRLQSRLRLRLNLIRFLSAVKKEFRPQCAMPQQYLIKAYERKPTTISFAHPARNK